MNNVKVKCRRAEVKQTALTSSCKVHGNPIAVSSDGIGTETGNSPGITRPRTSAGCQNRLLVGEQVYRNYLKLSVRLRHRLYVLLAFCWCLGWAAVAADWYLDRAATGLNNGASMADAWTNVNAVRWSSILPGDTLWIQGGVYNQHLDVANKNAIIVRIASNATQKAVFLGGQLYNADNCVIDGWLNGTQFFRFWSNCSHGANGYLVRETTNAVIRGIEVDRSAVYIKDVSQNHCIALGSGATDFITIDSCHLHHTTGDGINQGFTPALANHYRSVVVTNCTITDVGDDGMQLGGQITVVGNYVDNNNFPTYFGGHPDGLQTGQYTGNIKVFNNTFRGFNQNVFIEYASSNVYLYNNILMGFRTNGTDRAFNISADRQTATVTNVFTGEWVLANNTMYNFLSFSAINGGLPANRDSVKAFGNNLFINCKILAPSYMAEWMTTNNVYWDIPGTQFFDTTGAPCTLPSDRGIGLARNLDPKLVSPALGDFSLSIGSPAIGAGKNYSTYFTTDKAGVTRGPTWDLGALECQAETLLPPTNLRVEPVQ